MLLLVCLSWFAIVGLMLVVLNVGASAEREIMEELEREKRLKKYRN